MTNFATEKHLYINCFRNIENWLKLLTYSKNLNNATKILEDEDIDEICSRSSDHLDDVFDGLPPKRRATSIITMLNMLIRIYAVDQSNTITSRPTFQRMVKAFTKKTFTMIKSKEYAEYVTEMLDLLLMNFAKDDFIVKYLKQFFPNESISMTGNVVHDY